MLRQLAVALVVIACVRPIGAQDTSPVAPDPQRFFVAAGILADREAQFAGATSASLPVWRPGAAIEAGWFPWSRKSLRFAVHVPAWGDRTFERTFDYYDPGAGRVVRAPVITASASRTVAYAGLIGFHHRADQSIRVASLWGLGVIAQQDRIQNVARDTGIHINGGTSTQRAVAAVVGVETAWAASRHMELVGRVIGHMGLVYRFNEARTLMPSVALRLRY